MAKNKLAKIEWWLIISTLKDPAWAGNLKILKHPGLISWYYVQITTLTMVILVKNSGKGYKISFILSKKWMSLKGIAVFFELT